MNLTRRHAITFIIECDQHSADSAVDANSYINMMLNLFKKNYDFKVHKIWQTGGKMALSRS